MRQILTIGIVTVFGAGVAACGSDDGGSADGGGRPTVVVTTNILGDVVSSVVGDLAAVEVIMPLGADPHDFAPSARQAAAMEEADLLVINGAGFEEGMLGVIDSVTDSGTTVFAFADEVDLLEGGHDHAHDDEHGDEESHADEETHADEAGGFDPHLWTDPSRIIAGVTALSTALAALDGIDAASIEERTGDYLAELEALDGEIESLLAGVPDEQRILVTNHEVFG
jgi:zinc/manganese transport system substrate-binding protein